MNYATVVLITFICPIANDRPALPRASLPVGKEGGVEALPRTIQDAFPQVLVDSALSRDKILEATNENAHLDTRGLERIVG